MSTEMIVPEGQEWAPKDFHMAPAMVANGMVWMSGVVALQTKEGPEAMEAAMVAAFKTISKTLQASGSDMEHIVDILSYHCDLDAQMKTFMAVKDQFLPGPKFPCWTAIGITSLAVPPAICEIKVVAQLVES
ncbi:MAG: Rid family hydrolase [Minwuia sp.]|nr:Rid family hydrolase [Minwuia sp.]